MGPEQRLQPEDAGLPNLLRGLVDALRLRLPNLPDWAARRWRARSEPDAEELAPADGFAAALGQALELQLRGDLVLVIDDVHELPTAGPSARLVEGLARHAPARFHLVLSSRAEPPFPINDHWPRPGARGRRRAACARHGGDRRAAGGRARPG